MAVASRYCIQDAVVNYVPGEWLQTDNQRTDIYNLVFSNVDLSSKLDQIYNKRRIGKEYNCDIEKLFYLQMLVSYFQIIVSEITCTTADTYEDLAEEYKLDCIRNILTCNYGLGNLIEDLVELLGLRDPYDGISYMSINYNSCNPFQIRGVNP